MQNDGTCWNPEITPILLTNLKHTIMNCINTSEVTAGAEWLTSSVLLNTTYFQYSVVCYKGNMEGVHMEIFVSATNEDEGLRKDLAKQLALLTREGPITVAKI